MIYKGIVPENMCVLHTCDNRVCINPGHLFLGTQQDNIRDRVKKGRNKNPTHCAHGHEYTEENTYISPKGHKDCKRCRRIRDFYRFSK